MHDRDIESLGVMEWGTAGGQEILPPPSPPPPPPRESENHKSLIVEMLRA